MNLQPKSPEIIGEGKEKLVYADPENPEKVIAEFKEGESEETAQSLRGRFYFTKILHMLFPKNIPDIHLAAKNGKSVIVLERKRLGGLYRRLEEIAVEYAQKDDKDTEGMRALEAESRVVSQAHTRKVTSDVAFQRFNEAMENIGAKVDRHPVNFGYDRDGNLVYLDNDFRPWQLHLFVKGPKVEYLFDKEKIVQAIDSLRDSDKERAKQYLERIEKIAEEERLATEGKYYRGTQEL